MAFPPEFLRELGERCRIEDIAPSYVNLRRRGKNLVGLCPFHNEKTPSFCVYPENNSFYCFGCNKGGDIVTFIMGVENLDFTEAVRFLAQRAGMTLPEEGADLSMSRLRTRILEINRESGRFYFGVLSTPEGKPGLDYLRRRGLDPKTIRRFGLGYSPDSGFALVNHLKKLGYTQEELVQSDMVRRSQKGNLYDRYRGRVMFPIFDLRGNVVAFGGRILTDEKPKYLNTSDTPVYHKSSGLFAMNFAKDSGSRQLILAEGYMDVIALHRAGFTNAIASLGTALTEEQARIIRRYADEVMICYDSDEAGRRATQRAIPILKNAGLLVRVITVPGGKDPDEFFRTDPKDGPLRFKRLIQQSGNDTEYRLSVARDKYDLSTEDGKKRYLQEAVAQVLGNIRDPIELDVYAGKLAEETGVGKDSILASAKRAAAIQGKQRKKEELKAQREVVAARTVANPEKKRHMRAALAEEGILAYLFRHQDKAKALEQLLPPEKWVTPWGRRVYALILGKTIHGEITLSDLAGELSPEELSELTRVLAERREVPPNWGDVEEYCRIIQDEAGFTDPDKIREASQDDLKRYLEELKRRK
ncbi:dNA primase [Clostridium sp. CAG:1013]|nr:dNA primase [Clostridium sp. CAG:1013]